MTLKHGYENRETICGGNLRQRKRKREIRDGNRGWTHLRIPRPSRRHPSGLVEAPRPLPSSRKRRCRRQKGKDQKNSPLRFHLKEIGESEDHSQQPYTCYGTSKARTQVFTSMNSKVLIILL